MGPTGAGVVGGGVTGGLGLVGVSSHVAASPAIAIVAQAVRIRRVRAILAPLLTL
jgi:hypothetical protein